MRARVYHLIRWDAFASGSKREKTQRGACVWVLKREVERSLSYPTISSIMRTLKNYLCRFNPRTVPSRNFSSSSSPFSRTDELSVEEDVERKIGWLLKSIFVGTAAFVGYQFFPYMGDNMLRQSVSLLHVKDPFFKRSGASRLARYAVDDGRRMKIVEIGGAQELLIMLEAAKDDRTRKAALKALAAVSQSDEAVGALHLAGAISVIKSIPDSSEEAEIEKFKGSLLKRFQDLKYESSS